MSRVTEKIRSMENFKAIHDYLATDNTNRQSTASLLQKLATRSSQSPRVLDLGCGEGNSIYQFQQVFTSPEWHGVDIADSPEVRSRTRNAETIKTFDGINLPYPDKYFDLIYSNQVLEHVRHPDQLMRDAYRALKPGGIIAGAVSYLEPFHSYSIFNFTPYGIATVLSDAGFTVDEIRAGSDASRLINRQLLNRSARVRWLWNQNYIHKIIDLAGAVIGLGSVEKNFLKLQFAGHVFFIASRK